MSMSTIKKKKKFTSGILPSHSVLPGELFLFKDERRVCTHKNLFSLLHWFQLSCWSLLFKDFKSHNLISANGVSHLCVDPEINKPGSKARILQIINAECEPTLCTFPDQTQGSI